MLLVHTHPDDEVFGTGGVIARAADAGMRVVVVYCTRGEEGEIHDPDLDPDEARGRLGAIRMEEVRRAARVLGISEIIFLPYRDSGMAGTAANENRVNFHNAPLAEAAERLASIIRRQQPAVVLTYNEHGVYGHPDHIKAHLVTEAALPLAADPNFQDGRGPWQPAKFYHIVVSREDVQRGEAMARERGLNQGDEEWDPASWTVPDSTITTKVDVRQYLARKEQAMREHRTQIPGDDPLFQLPPDIAELMHGSESFVRRYPPFDGTERETDLFAGLRDG
jgi:N-acetyl-1-D-myo-inositol-2-amino-2-deoxy-alpha-D-glucopyranoside deacetylase